MNQFAFQRNVFFRTFSSVIILFLASSLIAPFAEAANVDAINELFQKNYRGSFYQSGRCGANTETFVRFLVREGINLDGAVLLQLENKGASNFGLVAALKAREQGRFLSMNPVPGRPEREYGTANWGYHAFVVAEGYVFDFDFENEPRAIPFIDYILEMYVPAQHKDNSAKVREALGGYQLTFFPIKRISSRDAFQLRGHELFQPSVEINLLDYLDSLPKSSPLK